MSAVPSTPCQVPLCTEEAQGRPCRASKFSVYAPLSFGGWNNNSMLTLETYSKLYKEAKNDLGSPTPMVNSRSKFNESLKQAPHVAN